MLIWNGKSKDNIYYISPVDAFAITLKWPQNGAARESLKFGHQHTAYLKYGHMARG